MIAPDMATMLVLRLHRRADRRRRAAGAAVEEPCKARFNAITVDSDTSTSDTLMLFATGAAKKRGAPKIDEGERPRLADFGRRSTPCCSISPIRSCGTARARASSSRSR